MIKADRKEFIKMDANENPYGCSPALLKVFKTFSTSDLSLYPDTSQLIEKIAEYWQVDSRFVAISNGSDDLLRNIIDISVESGGKVVLPEPTFSMNRVFLGLKKARIFKITSEVKNSFPLHEIIKVSGKVDPGLIIIVNPTVPYGQKIKRTEIEKILGTFPETILLVDEAYGEFSGSTVIDLTKKYKNLIVIRTFSKAFGLAGIRMGYSISSPDISERLKKNLSPYSSSSLALKLAQTALDNAEWMKEKTDKIVKERDRLFNELEKIGLNPVPSEANFLTVLSPVADKIYKYLLSEKIIVRFFEKRASLPEKVVRISVGTEKENEILIKKLKNLLDPPAIIFDMDGVLVDVSESYIEAIKKTVKKLSGKPTTDEKIEKLKLSGGFNNDWELTHEILKRRKIKISYEEVVKFFQEIYLGKDFSGLIEKESLLIDKKFLEKLSKSYRIALFTGRPQPETEFVINRFKLGKYFSSVITMNDVKKQKPSPEGVFLSLKKIKSGSAIYFGDTVDDMKSAKSAGCIGIGVLEKENRLSAEKALVDAGAAFVIKNINEAGAIL